ncbi:excisionase family DNA-binding protein [Amycolatopsis carbonis]|uniref:excisionase family DNA-binding protein n=1 Tax=Amycolatopsis carbonis TaxID=715471 RepID=UPI00333E260F
MASRPPAAAYSGDEGEGVPRRVWKPFEVAAQLGVPYETVLGLIHDGHLNALKAGRYYLIPDFEFERYLHSCERC